MITVGSLFAGVGGLELGLEWTGGFETKWQVEIDDYATKVLEKHWPNVRRWRDVRTFPPPVESPWLGAKWREEWGVDLICGGFPCTDISYAGKGEGLAGKQSGLWSEYIRVIGLLRPHFVIVENVPALFVRGIDVVLGQLAQVGYDAEWSVVPACSMGAPHTRERVFIVSYPNGMFRAARMGFNGDEQSWLQQRNARKVQANWLEAVAANSGSAHGISDWSHRCRCLGNAVVPQVAQWIGQRILAAEANQ